MGAAAPVFPRVLRRHGLVLCPIARANAGAVPGLFRRQPGAGELVDELARECLPAFEAWGRQTVFGC